VIAGPILRRVERDSVSVFVACKNAVSGMRLEVSDGSGVVVRSEPTDTVAFGDNLHVAVVTARESRTPLAPEMIYSYDLTFGGRGGLAEDGVLGGSGAISKVTYGRSATPTFVFPSDRPAGLRFVHGSCRKPHGGKTDALRALDTILEATHDDSSQRPQQLFLTGDQIYADDVADGLLFMLIDAISPLLGWDESLPGPIAPERLAVGNRQATINDADLTSGAARSHLIRLGEYYAMYLFAWSPELWPDAEDLPSFQDVFGMRSTQEQPSFGGVVLSRLEPVETEEYATFLRTRASLKKFRRSLPFVRKALANIPTYMMFDDHEVTDDWFLTRRWCESTLGPNTLSRRIIQNGLAAFAVFQAWGNMPTYYRATSSDGHRLLSLLATLHAHRGAAAQDWLNIGDTIIPELQGAGRRRNLSSRYRWDFRIPFSAHQVIALDSRTRRGWGSPGGPPNLVHSGAISEQLSDSSDSKPLTVVIAPAPVVGHDFVERICQPIGVQLLSPFRGPEAAGAELDYEAWSLNPRGFEELLERLAGYGRVLILSGDVHYSFTASVQYWDHRPARPRRRAAFAQLCSSSLKNEIVGTHIVARLRVSDADLVGWEEPGRHIRRGEGNRYVAGRPAVHRLVDDEEVARPPEWLYRITFHQDLGSSSSRGTPGFGELPRTGQATVYPNREQHSWERGRAVVGYDALGSIAFSWTSSAQEVHHELWYAPHGAQDRALLRPYTRHTAPLTIPTSDTPPPRTR
jgi:hypothetical protein